MFVRVILLSCVPSSEGGTVVLTISNLCTSPGDLQAGRMAGKQEGRRTLLYKPLLITECDFAADEDSDFVFSRFPSFYLH